MLSFLTGILPFLQPVLTWWTKRQARKDAAEEGFKDDLAAHAGDGQASVDIRNSYDEQVAELKRQREAAQVNGAPKLPETPNKGKP